MDELSLERVKVHPRYLHSNSTSHIWVFGAFAELIDNVHDLGTGASVLRIDALKLTDDSDWCITFTDNGNGLNPEELLNMLSFGYSEKRRGVNPVGQYGNGFKSASMRIGRDALVLTKCRKSQTMSVGFLSQTFLEKVGAESIVVPVVQWDMVKKKMATESTFYRRSLDTITKHSIFRTEADLLKEFDCISAPQSHLSGTRIIIYNLKKDERSDKLELDLESAKDDILNSESASIDGYCRPEPKHIPGFRRSLHEYCSILYLESKVNIFVRGKQVKRFAVSETLSDCQVIDYKPKFLASSRPALKITYGMARPGKDYGMCLYYRKRLIKAYKKVGCQKRQSKNEADQIPGFGVVGVVDVDSILTPIHNKQDFEKDERYNACMSTFGKKLRQYWVVTKCVTDAEGGDDPEDWTWAQCNLCSKYRRLIDGTVADDLPDVWTCSMNTDTAHNRCEVPQEPTRSTALTYLETPTRKRRKSQQLTSPVAPLMKKAKRMLVTESLFRQNSSNVQQPHGHCASSAAVNQVAVHGNGQVDAETSSDNSSNRRIGFQQGFHSAETVEQCAATTIMAFESLITAVDKNNAASDKKNSHCEESQCEKASLNCKSNVGLNAATRSPGSEQHVSSKDLNKFGSTPLGSTPRCAENETSAGRDVGTRRVTSGKSSVSSAGTSKNPISGHGDSTESHVQSRDRIISNVSFSGDDLVSTGADSSESRSHSVSVTASATNIAQPNSNSETTIPSVSSQSNSTSPKTKELTKDQRIASYRDTTDRFPNVVTPSSFCPTYPSSPGSIPSPVEIKPVGQWTSPVMSPSSVVANVDDYVVVTPQTVKRDRIEMWVRKLVSVKQEDSTAENQNVTSVCYRPSVQVAPVIQQRTSDIDVTAYTIQQKSCETIDPTVAIAAASVSPTAQWTGIENDQATVPATISPSLHLTNDQSDLRLGTTQQINAPATLAAVNVKTEVNLSDQATTVTAPAVATVSPTLLSAASDIRVTPRSEVHQINTVNVAGNMTTEMNVGCTSHCTDHCTRQECIDVRNKLRHLRMNISRVFRDRCKQVGCIVLEDIDQLIDDLARQMNR